MVTKDTNTIKACRALIVKALENLNKEHNDELSNLVSAIREIQHKEITAENLYSIMHPNDTYTFCSLNKNFEVLSIGLKRVNLYNIQSKIGTLFAKVGDLYTLNQGKNSMEIGTLILFGSAAVSQADKLTKALEANIGKIVIVPQYAEELVLNFMELLNMEYDNMEPKYIQSYCMHNTKVEELTSKINSTVYSFTLEKKIIWKYHSNINYKGDVSHITISDIDDSDDSLLSLLKSYADQKTLQTKASDNNKELSDINTQVQELSDLESLESSIKDYVDEKICIPNSDFETAASDPNILNAHHISFYDEATETPSFMQ